MFVINTYDGLDNSLVFIKSSKIKAFPCGRRRSNLIDRDGNQASVDDRYYIPFDPEARLNTEANNRKHSGLNGFKQSYLNYWNADTISLVLSGYLFNIDISEQSLEPMNLGKLLETDQYLGSANDIYANIKLANIKFFDGGDGVEAAATEVLRDQTLNDSPSTCLDFLIDGNTDAKDTDNYYFAGLSFSKTPLSGEGVVSLRLLVKDANGWHIHNPSRLPKVDHGDTADSIKVGTVQAGAIEANNIETRGVVGATAVRLKDANNRDSYAVTMKVQENNGVYQLQFYAPKLEE